MKKELVISGKKRNLYKFLGILSLCMTIPAMIIFACGIITEAVLVFVIIMLVIIALCFDFALIGLYECPECGRGLIEYRRGFHFFDLEPHRYCPACGTEVEVRIE